MQECPFYHCLAKQSAAATLKCISLHSYIHISSKQTTMCSLEGCWVGSETLQRRTAWGCWMKRKDLTESASLFPAGGWNKLLHLVFLELQEFYPVWAVLYRWVEENSLVSPEEGEREERYCKERNSSSFQHIHKEAKLGILNVVNRCGQSFRQW